MPGTPLSATDGLADAVIAHIDDLIYRYSRGSKLRSTYDFIDHLLDLRNVVVQEAHLASPSFVRPPRRRSRS
jgi:hypothetical protein